MRRIVQAHLGRIEVESEPGRTRFIVRLRIARSLVPDEAAGRRAPAANGN